MPPTCSHIELCRHRFRYGNVIKGKYFINYIPGRIRHPGIKQLLGGSKGTSQLRPLHSHTGISNGYEVITHPLKGQINLGDWRIARGQFGQGDKGRCPNVDMAEVPITKNISN